MNIFEVRQLTLLEIKHNIMNSLNRVTQNIHFHLINLFFSQMYFLEATFWATRLMFLISKVLQNL